VAEPQILRARDTQSMTNAAALFLQRPFRDTQRGPGHGPMSAIAEAEADPAPAVSTAPLRPVLIVACGNPLREDDAMAWHVARTFEGSDNPFEVVRVQELCPELAASFAGRAGVVFVDARRDGPPGAVFCDELAPAAPDGAFTHVLGPATLLLYAERLHGRAPRACLVSIVGERFGFGESLSPAVRRALPEVVLRLRRLGREWSAAGKEPLRAGRSGLVPSRPPGAAAARLDSHGDRS
jgi:hydrogenase maturation protease